MQLKKAVINVLTNIIVLWKQTNEKEINNDLKLELKNILYSFLEDDIANF